MPRINKTYHHQSKLGLFILDGVTAGNHHTCLTGLFGRTAQDFTGDFRGQVGRQRGNIQRQKRFTTHSVNIGKAVGSRDRSVVIRVIDHRGKEVGSQDQRARFIQPPDGGIIGSIQANEAIKLVLAAGQPLVGRLLLFDALDLRFREVRVRPDPDCPICGTRPTIRELQEYDDFCGARPPSPSGRHDVTPIELKQKLDAGERPVLLDVREPMEHLLEAGTWLQHAHTSDDERRFPSPDGYDQRRFLQYLKRAGYGGRLSFECRVTEDYEGEARRAVKYVRHLWEALDLRP